MKLRTKIQVLALACAVSLPAFGQTDRVANGTEITIRTNEAIDAKSPSESRIYTGVVDQDVLDTSGRVLIPRGSDTELIVRDVSSQDVVLDLESVTVAGRRYIVSTTDKVVTADDTNKRDGVGTNKRTGKYVGGGAVIGSIIGAIAGGGKGAAIGAATGAGAGAVGQTVTRGGNVRVPSETLLTFRLDRSLQVSSDDDRYTRDGVRYKRYRNNNNNNQYNNR